MTEKEPENIVEVLKDLEGYYVEVSYTYHNEGILRFAEGWLRRVTKDIIEMEVEGKKHFWERMQPRIFFLNRHACQLGSVVLLSLELTDNGFSESVDE